jgi:plastocyanin
MVRRLLLLAAIAVAALPALVASGGAAPAAKKPKPKTVRVGDDFYACASCTGNGTRRAKLSVRSGTTIVWKWGAANQDTHDVVAYKRPRRVKKFRSELATADFSYRKTLRTRGTYRFLCSVHANVMRMTIVVK